MLPLIPLPDVFNVRVPLLTVGSCEVSANVPVEDGSVIVIPPDILGALKVTCPVAFANIKDALDPMVGLAPNVLAPPIF